MKGSLLIVDDEAEIREMLQRHFTLLGYECDTAENGKEALTILSEKRKDVVISDIQMPVMDGVELLHTIREDYPLIRVVMMTGYVTLANAMACMQGQADTVVFKPFEDLNELEEAVDTALSYLRHWQKKLRELQGMKG